MIARYTVIFLIFASCIYSVSGASLRVSSLFTDNMVIQRNANAPIWGEAAPGSEIRLSIKKHNFSTKADQHGKWMIKLSPMKACAVPFSIKIESGGKKIILKNILIGDVWLCSGQSNMAWKVSKSNNAKQEISRAKYPGIRIFTVKPKVSLKPLSDVSGKWLECKPENIGNFSATAYYFGRELYKSIKIPIGLLNCSVGGSCIEAWTPWKAQKHIPAAVNRKKRDDRIAATYDKAAERVKFLQKIKIWQEKLKAWRNSGKKGPTPRKPRFFVHPHKYKHYPSGLYNGMVVPICPFAIKGAIWYQGESNGGTARYYQEQLKSLISSWRTNWKQGDFPFYFVQLPNFRVPSKHTEVNCNKNRSWPILREAFRQTTKKVPNTGMAVIIDIGEVKNVHPGNKQDVGDRIARLALKKTYGKNDIVWTGPLLKSVKISGVRAEISFENGGSPLTVKGKGPIKWFALADSEGRIIPAKAVITGPDKLVVSAPGVKQINAVYYAWAMNPAGLNLINRAGLPTSPFRWKPASTARSITKNENN